MQKRVCLTSSCLLFLLSACGGSSSPAPGGDGVPDANVDVARDPFAPQPDTSEGLTNVSADLRALLENGALATACADYAAAPADRRKRLLCGKAMFFYEGFGTAGVPVPLADWLIANFPDDVGPGFGKLGMVPDPFSTKSYPLGLAPGAPIGSVGTLAFTCASCHFGASAARHGQLVSTGSPNTYEFRTSFGLDARAKWRELPRSHRPLGISVGTSRALKGAFVAPKGIAPPVQFLA